MKKIISVLALLLFYPDTTFGMEKPDAIDTSTNTAKESEDAELLYQRGNEARAVKDTKLTIECWERASALGNSEAQNDLASLYLDLREISHDEADKSVFFRKAARLYLESAHKGQISAHYNLGILFLQRSEKSLDKNKREILLTNAIYWFDLATEKGHNRAGFRLGIIYQTEAFKTSDRAKKIELMDKAEACYLAVIKNEEMAKYNLSTLYVDKAILVNGREKEFLLYKALELIILPAYENNPGAQYNLGAICDMIRHCVTSAEEKKAFLNLAESWFRAAAAQGSAHAQFKLSVILKEKMPAKCICR